ncbi:gluconolaconase [Mucilaginibacter robiniae]|uniref:Gluconolaconase n=1 Tax=Mucilaginibacter robiniae TaxID=2728022 RepID=A0A7L5E3Y4_9SPHI|nr:gluconolaconase [Mucilaginibacter robiniae]QJD96404.1 gluconolaconase [Mucilaginibacter robiniae]
MNVAKYFLLSVVVLLNLSSNAQTPRINFTLPGLYPEGLAYNPKNNLFYVSSETTGSIGTVDQLGIYRPFYQNATFKSSYGLKVDAKQNRLWACVSDATYSWFSDSTTYKKTGRLVAIDLGNGRKVADINLAKLYAGKHFLNDLTFDNAGNIYVTDSYSPVIYKVDAQGKASIFAQSDLFGGEDIGLNGIAYNPQGFLVVNNDSQGALYRVDIKDPKSIVKVNVDDLFPGADGMLFSNDSTLVLIQNKSVDKVHQLISPDGFKTAEVRMSTSSEDRFQQPSTGTTANGQLYVLNSKVNELSDPTKRPSKDFSIQLVEFKPAQ